MFGGWWEVRNAWVCAFKAKETACFASFWFIKSADSRGQKDQQFAEKSRGIG